MKELGWSTFEQSKRLIEAGLDPETADMFYVNVDECLYSAFPMPNHNNIFKKQTCDNPCWSLGVLIDLLPKTIETNNPKNLYFKEIFLANNGIAYIACNEHKEMVFLKMFGTGVEGNEALIDNTVSMICWLLDNNYIKKEK